MAEADIRQLEEQYALEQELGWQDQIRQEKEARRKAKILKAQEKAREEKGIKAKAAEAATAPVRMGTSWLLRAAWSSITTVFGFIFLGLPYINLHVFGRFVFGERIFCKLGDEWVPKKAKALIGEVGQLGGRAIGVVEIITLLFLDVIIISAIIAILVIIILLVKMIGSPGVTIIEIIKSFFSK